MAASSSPDSSSDDGTEIGEPIQRTISSQTALTTISAAQTDAGIEAVDMDEEAADLALQLQLEDVEELAEKQKGKQIEGTQNDAEDALAVYKQELQQNQTLLSDRRIARSIGRAVVSDARILRSITDQEDIAAADRLVALRAGGIALTQGPELLAIEAPPEDPTLIQRLAKLNIVPGQHPMKECLACMDHKHHFDIMEVPCAHGYCRACVIHMFEAAIADESSFPPRCCEEITVAVARDFLSPELVQRYEAKAFEFSTPNRTYCSTPTCSTFIPPNQIRIDVGTCPRCRHQTCTICKAASHTGDCPEDPSHQSLLATAQREGWQQCYSCHRLVEIHYGCNHMT